jgi:4'-phosphopantetheinyl transferase
MRLRNPDWEVPSRAPDAPAPSVQIWRLRLGDLDGDLVEAFRPLTVPSEHARARRYKFEADRHRHLGGRALVRLVLARQYNCAPRDLSLVEGPHGKPRLQEPPNDGPTLHFNVAHTANVVVAAFSRAHPVGIDVESLTRDADMEALAQRVLTEAERKHWRAFPKARREDGFIHLWTCKEAFLKATGRGLQRALHSIECCFDGSTVVDLDDAEGYAPSSPDNHAGRWAVRPFLASESIAGAVVRKHSLPWTVAWADAAQLVNRHSPS